MFGQILDFFPSSCNVVHDNAKTSAGSCAEANPMQNNVAELSPVFKENLKKKVSLFTLYMLLKPS